jgi:bifunctional diaminopimelate decarboxylase / aspartate kinase
MSSSLPDAAEQWLVLKFGGTSVSTVVNWHNIAQVLRARLAEGFRPVVVHSALSGITDRLESLLSAAMNGSHLAVLEQIELAHRSLAERLGVVPNAQFDRFVQELRELATLLAERRAISDAARARIMAMGELLATTLGSEFLNAQGIGTVWLDARTVLRADDRLNATQKASFLSATCDFSPDANLQAN